jgi:hypothetical protein
MYNTEEETSEEIISASNCICECKEWFGQIRDPLNFLSRCLGSTRQYILRESSHLNARIFIPWGFLTEIFRTTVAWVQVNNPSMTFAPLWNFVTRLVLTTSPTSNPKSMRTSPWRPFASFLDICISSTLRDRLLHPLTVHHTVVIKDPVPGLLSPSRISKSSFDCKWSVLF